MSTKQPIWKLVANLGDRNPIDHGGFFVFEDTTGVYPPEAELLEAPESEPGTWTVYRFALDPCTFNPKTGVLSDNPYHPDHPAWFAQPESKKATRPQDTTYLSNVAESSGLTLDELRKLFCSDDACERAVAYRMVGDYHGFENLDQYPLQFVNRSEVDARYQKGGPRGPQS